ncbi:MAG: dehydrogenase [bacterium]|nr:dehydrogenase [bacterium]
MRFVITAGRGEGPSDSERPLDEAMLVAYMRFNEEMHRAGILVASEGLNPAASGARVVASGGTRRVLDGPFAESKELVGGFYVVDVDSLDEAIAWALRCPVGMGTDDVLDVRPLTGASDIPPEVMRIIREAAPTWSASMEAERGRGAGG